MREECDEFRKFFNVLRAKIFTPATLFPGQILLVIFRKGYKTPSKMSIIKLVYYNIWANRLIAREIESLTPPLFEKEVGGSFGSIKATVIHLMESDWLWVNRFKGIPLATVPAWQFKTPSEVLQQWLAVQEEMLYVAKTLANYNGKIIKFLTRKGVPYELPLEDLIVHVTNHGTYHRGQITHMLRVVGQQPVSTDYFIFCTQPPGN